VKWVKKEEDASRGSIRIIHIPATKREIPTGVSCQNKKATGDKI